MFAGLVDGSFPPCNEYQFPQLGPHWIWQSNWHGLNPSLEEGGNSAIGTRKLNTGFNEGNSNIGLAKEAEIDATTVLGE
jgi:hypothetical protein